MPLLDLFPSRVAIGHVNGSPVMASAEFIRALDGVFRQLGGHLGPSTTDLAQSDDDDSGLEEFKHESAKALDALAMVPVNQSVERADPLHPLPYEHPRIEALETEIASLREQLDALRKTLDGLLVGTTL